MRTIQAWLQGMNPNWSLTRPKAIFTERRESNHIDDVHLTPSQALGVLPQDEYMTKSGNRVVLNLSGQDNMKHVEKNDFIIHLRSFQGGIEHSQFKGKVSSAYTVLRPNARIEPRFFRWVLKSSGYIQELNASTDQLRDGQSIKFGQFAAIDLPLPPIEEQRRIADFLDDQVTRIDQAVRLIRSREQLLQDVFTHAVANAFAKLRDSDDAAQVPLRYLVRSIQTGSTPAESLADTHGVPWYTPAAFSNFGELGEPTRHIKTDATRAENLVLVKAPAVLIIGIGATGKVALLDHDAATNQQITALTTRSSVEAQFLFWQFWSRSSELRGKALFTTLPILNNDYLSSIVLLQVPLEVQYDLVETLSMLRDRVTKLRSHCMRSSSLLEERKRALITGAVTGELDVTAARRISDSGLMPSNGFGSDEDFFASIGGMR